MTGGITYARESSMTADAFIDVLTRSGLAERRPVGDPARIQRMLDNASLIVTARDGDLLVGISRAMADFAYCCYLSDLAVDRNWQGQGIGRKLITETHRYAGEESMCLLLSAPGAMTFYEAIGMPKADNAFVYPRAR